MPFGEPSSQDWGMIGFVQLLVPHITLIAPPLIKQAFLLLNIFSGFHLRRYSIAFGVNHLFYLHT
jgi:hypothetical protein